MIPQMVPDVTKKRFFCFTKEISSVTPVSDAEDYLWETLCRAGKGRKMKSKRRGKRGWLGKLFCGGALGLSSASGSLQAQTLPDPKTPPMVVNPGTTSVVNPGTVLPQTNPADPNQPTNPITPAPDPAILDPLAPAWVDPVTLVPNLFGGFFGTSLEGTQAGKTYQTFLPGKTVTTPLHLTGVGAEGNTGTEIIPPGRGGPAAIPAIPSNVLVVNGPGGPYILTSIIPVSNPHSLNTVPLTQNAELTNLVHGKYPGATFVDGSVTFTNLFSFTAPANFYYDYLTTSTTPPQVTTHTTPQLNASLPNPAGGGLVGRNLYFENGTALPQDRVYFFYNYAGNYAVQGNTLGINSFVFGGEKTFLDGLFSVEVRVPFAGTLNREQNVEGFSVDQMEFGNVGIAVKGVVYRTANFVASVGLGFSLPTAGTSQMNVGGSPLLEILNRTCLLQPLLGLAWAPNDRFFAQAGLQFDIDPVGNQVKGLNSTGGLSNIGVMHDPCYSYLNAATGYWLYRSNTGAFTGFALQTELDYYASLGSQNGVQSGGLSVTDSMLPFNSLNLTPGAILEFGRRTRLSLGVSFPIAGERIYSWNLMAQLNYYF
jgi:hypothetical protein